MTLRKLVFYWCWVCFYKTCFGKIFIIFGSGKSS